MEKLTKLEYWTQRTLPQVYDDSLSYQELLYKVISYLNDLIESQNATIEEVEKLLTWFNSLDVQDEINAKLDAMVLDGTMDTIINQTIFNDLTSRLGHLEKGDKILVSTQYATLGEAIETLNVGTKKILFIPDGTYNVTAPFTVSSDDVELVLAPKALVKTTGVINAFIVTGKNVMFSGHGVIEGPGTFDGTNTKWLDNEALVLINGNGFRMKETRIKNIHKVGVGVRGASDVQITETKIEGNFPASSWTGTQTAHFGIAIDPSFVGGGEDILITHNHITGCVQGVFTGNYGSGIGYGINISHNIFKGCHNHGIYSINGVGSTLNDNTFNRCALAIAILGDHANISGNTIYTSQTGNNLDTVGISVREATHCNIKGNVIKGDAENGSVIIDLVNLTGNKIDSNIVEGNIINITAGTAIAIRIGRADTTDICSDNQIKNNRIKTKGNANTGLISVYTKTTGSGKDNQVTGNNITLLNAVFGIHLYYQNGIIASGNSIKVEYNATVAEVVTLVNSINVEDSIVTGNRLRCDVGFGANINLRGYLENSASARNLVTNNNINFQSTTLTAKTEIGVQVASKAISNMVNGAFVA